MEQRTKNILIIVALLIAAGVVLNIIYNNWWTFIVGVITFVTGYVMGRKSKSKKK